MKVKHQGNTQKKMKVKSPSHLKCLFCPSLSLMWSAAAVSSSATEGQ